MSQYAHPNAENIHLSSALPEAPRPVPWRLLAEDPEACNRYPSVLESANLIRFCTHRPHESMEAAFAADFALRSHFSRFSFLKDPRTLPGPDAVFAHLQRDAREIFRKLLGLEVTFPEASSAWSKTSQIYTTHNYFRSHIEEIFVPNGEMPLPPLEGICLMFFGPRDCLNIRYILRNPSQTPLQLELTWHSRPHTSAKLLEQKTGFAVEVLTKVEFEVPVRAEVDSPLPFHASDEGFRSAPQNLILEGGKTEFFDFRVRFLNLTETPECPNVALDEAWETSLVLLENRLSALPPLDAQFSQFRAMALNAAGNFYSNTCIDPDSHGKLTQTIRGMKTGVDATWFWDTPIYAMGLLLIGDLDTARGAFRLLADGIDEKGHPPSTFVNNFYLRPYYQQPNLAWGINLFNTQASDSSLTHHVFPALERYVLHWLRDNDANDNGLVEYPRGSLCWDDALRWNEHFPCTYSEDRNWATENFGEMRQDLFENPDTNSFLYLECRSLANMARHLDLADRAKEWDLRAEKLAQAINELLFDHELGVYQERSIVTGEFTGMITPACFMPIFAGIPTPVDPAEMCRQWLLSPEHFLTPMPFATLDRSHPFFRSGGHLFEPPSHPGAHIHRAYWHGRSWPNINYWILGALWRCGLHSEADAIAETILRAMSRHESLNECYDSLTGEPNGHAECTHGPAGALALLYRLYRLGPLGESPEN